MPVEMTNYVSDPNWIIWCVETKDGFMAMGSRKINQLDFSAQREFDDVTSFGYSRAASSVPTISSYDLTSSLRGATMVVGKTELEALCSLITLFKEEETKEKQDKELFASKLQIKKLEDKEAKRLHKKAKKQARQGKFDAAKCPENCSYCEEDDKADFYGNESYYQGLDYGNYECCEDCG